MKRPRVIARFAAALRRRSDAPSEGTSSESALSEDAQPKRTLSGQAAPASGVGPAAPAPDSRDPAASDKTWADVGGEQLDPDAHVQLAGSRPEPGGVPVRVDPEMVNPATAERMRPLIRP